ncbi:hypothetical protein AAEX28_14500 [Lentisphaerota bacterium WC36G]|nr:hypothetical protein LJT99_01255 [Lentisphaerae bacterium WC36]
MENSPTQINSHASQQNDKNSELEKAKKYIEKNAMKFDFIALFKLLEKIGYYIETDVEFVLHPSLESAEAYIQKVYFADNLHKAFVYLNDYQMAFFLDEIKNEYEENYHSIVKFFITLFNEMLRASNKVMFPDAINGEFKNAFKDGDSLISLNDGNLKSFSFIYNFLKQLFSDYYTVIFEHNQRLRIELEGVVLGDSLLNYHCYLGSSKRVVKLVVCLIIMTENALTKKEIIEIKERLNIFCKFFKNCLNEINIIIKNFVTDTDLYTIFPVELSYDKILLQKIYNVAKEVASK